MQITGTHFNYFRICHRKLWLFANGINMEQESELVYTGKLIHENSYPQRSEKYEEVEMDGIKVDYYDARNKVIHEIKKSNKLDEAHVWQLKYYMFVFEEHGIAGVKGVLEYPELRKKQDVVLTDDDRDEIRMITQRITEVVESEECPALIKKGYCKSCSYYEFCFAKEEDKK